MWFVCAMGRHQLSITDSQDQYIVSKLSITFRQDRNDDWRQMTALEMVRVAFKGICQS